MYTETKKIHVFDYLSALIKETLYNRVTVSELIEGRIYTKNGAGLTSAWTMTMRLKRAVVLWMFS